MLMYFYIWEYTVLPEYRENFERLYGPTGAWANLFRRDPAYLGTELLRDQSEPNRFITVDSWATEEAFMLFRENNRKQFDAIDAVGGVYTQRERCHGTFDLVDTSTAT